MRFCPAASFAAEVSGIALRGGLMCHQSAIERTHDADGGNHEQRKSGRRYDSRGDQDGSDGSKSENSAGLQRNRLPSNKSRPTLHTLAPRRDGIDGPLYWPSRRRIPRRTCRSQGPREREVSDYFDARNTRRNACAQILEGSALWQIVVISISPSPLAPRMPIAIDGHFFPAISIKDIHLILRLTFPSELPSPDRDHLILTVALTHIQ